MDASEILCSTLTSNALSTEMSLTPTPQTPPPAMATTPRTTTHTPREIPTMYILDQMYDDYVMDQYNGNNIATPTETPDTNASLDLAPCPICSRTFNPVSLRKHVGICEKMAIKKRHIFDSSRQRREGTELATYPLPKNFGLPEKSSSSSMIAQARNERGLSPKPAAVTQQVSSPLMARKKPTEDLIRSTARASMRKASTPNAAAPSPNSNNTTPSSNFTRDRLRSSERSLTRRGIQPLPSEQCPHCERCFGIKAFDRHVEWCKEKALQAAIKQGHTNKTDGNVAKARWEARTKYRAPCLKTKRSLNREKYSGQPGDENEPEDTTKYLKSSNKTPDNNLMSMSMTSSMTSERKITNPTGNINEPSKTAAKTKVAAATIAKRKCTFDKSQTPHTPPTTKTTPTATLATSMTEDIQESIINFEIEMPDFRLMGEQLATAAINKKLRGKIKNAKSNLTTTAVKPQKQKMISSKCDQKLETTDVKINLALTSMKAHQKTQSDLSLKSIHLKESYESGGNNDDDNYNDNDHENEERISPTPTIDLPTSFLPEKLLKEEVIKTKIMTKSLEKSDKKSKDNYKTSLSAPEQNFDKNDLIKQQPRSTSKHSKEKITANSKNILHIEDGSHDQLNDCHILGSKKTMVLRQDGKRIQAKSEKPTNNEVSEEQLKDLSIFLENLNLREGNLKSRTFKPENFESSQQEMIMKQSYQLDLDDNDNDFDNLENERIDSIISSIPKISVPQSPLKSKNQEKVQQFVSDDEFESSENIESKEIVNSPEIYTKHQLRNFESREEKTTIQNPKYKDLSRETSFDQIKEKKKIEFLETDFITSTPKHKNSSRSLTSQKPVIKHSNSNEKLSESEIYKDFLTDSDELRRENLKKSLGGSKERIKEIFAFAQSSKVINTPRETNVKEAVKSDFCTVKESHGNETNTSFKSSTKSDTFILEIDNKQTKDLGKEVKEQSHNEHIKTPRNADEFYTPPKRITNIKEPEISSKQEIKVKTLNRPQSITSKVNSSNPKTEKTLNSKTYKPNENSRVPKSLRLPRALTPSPPRQLPKLSKPHSPQSLPTTPRSTSSSTTQHIQTKLPTSPIKPLSICIPKRKKVLSKNVSCSSTLPMKAIPLGKERINNFGVSSVPHAKYVNKRIKECLNTDDKDVKEFDMANTCMMDKEIKVIKEPPQLKRNKSFTVSGLPDNYDPFLSAKRQMEELCSPTTTEAVTKPTTTTTTPQTPKLPSLPATPNTNRMSTSLILSSSTPNSTPSPMTTSQIPQQTPKTPTMTRSSSFRRTASLRGPRRSPMLTSRPPLFAQKQRPTIQRGLSDEGPISTNFLKTEEYDEMPVRSVCVNDFAITNSPRVVRRDTSGLQRKQQQQTLKLNINAANAITGGSAGTSPNIREPEIVPTNMASKYVSKTDSLAVFLKYEHELEKLNNAASKREHLEDIKEPTTASTSTDTTPLANLDGCWNAKELKDKSNNLSKQNSAKNIKADILDLSGDLQESHDHNLNTVAAAINSLSNDAETSKYGQVRLTPLSSKPTTPLTKPQTPLTKPNTPLAKPSTPINITKPNTPLTKPTTPQFSTTALTPLNINVKQQQQPVQEHLKTPKSPKPVALSSIFTSERTTKQPTTHSSLLYGGERKNSVGSDYIDPKLINKCDNLPINLNLKRTDFKHSDSDTSEPRMEHFSSSSSESSAPNKKSTSLMQQTKFLPLVKQQQQQQEQIQNSNNLNQNYSPHQNPPHPQNTPSISNSQRNSAEGRNLLKRRMRLGRNQFLYDASPEGDSCSADDEANRSSMECDNHNFLKEHEKAFERLSNAHATNQMEPPFIPPLPAFDDFDFEEFLSSFENDEEQFPLFKDCREFLLNRTSKKQRSMLMPNSNTLTNNSNNNSMNFKKSSQQTFPPLTPQAQSSHHSTQQQHFQFPTLPQHPRNLFNSFSHSSRAQKNKYDDLHNTRSTDTFVLQPNSEDFVGADDPYDDNHQKREIFISIETEHNDLDKSPISPNSIRNMVGNPQTVVEVEVDSAHDNKFSKILDDDADCLPSQQGVLKSSSMTRSKNFAGHLEHLPNVQLNNAKNLIQQMQDDFRQLGEEMTANMRQTMDHRTMTTQADINSNLTSPTVATRKVNKATGTPSGDAYPDSDELSSLDGYPLSSPNSRFGVSSKTSADSAYGSLSRQRSSELTSQRNSSRNRPIATANTLLNRPLTEETSLGRSRQLSASSTSSSEHGLPPITTNNSYTKQQQQQQQQHGQHLYNNNNNIANDLDDMMRYERNNNYDGNQSTNMPTTSNSQSNLESASQLFTSNSTMSTSMKVSRFCHECGSKFLLEQAKFCMDCGVKRIVL